jgi:hypothetical protein
MEVDSEQDERPEHDCEQRGDDATDSVDVLEVMVACGDRDSDPEIDDREDAGADPHVRRRYRLAALWQNWGMEPEHEESGGGGLVEKAKEEIEAAKVGEAEETPLVVLGGLSIVLGAIVGIAILAGLLVWWLA